MNRDFITAVISRAMHEDIFLQLWQNDAEAAANAMEMTYDQSDLRELQAIHEETSRLDFNSAREYLRNLTQQSQGVFGSPQRTEE